jgi:hypothetical protein
LVQGVYLGYLLAKRLGGNSSRFIWILPLGMLGFLWAHGPSPRSDFFEHFSSQGLCGINDGCLNKALMSLMFMGSAGYSFGAFLGLRRRRALRLSR